MVKNKVHKKNIKEDNIFQVHGYNNCLPLLKKSQYEIIRIDILDQKKDFFATSILAESINLQFDSEGRVQLPIKLLKHAKIKNSMLFVGQGKTFQIWEPTNFEKFKTIAKKKSNIYRSSLKWEKQLNN